MKNKEDIISHLIEKINKTSEKKRNLEDWCKKVLIDPKQDRAYIALEAYRLALVEFLEDVKGDNNERLFGENKSFKTRGRG